MKIPKINPKEIAFTVIAWVIVLWSINFVCGLIVQNRYIAVDPISDKTQKISYGYYEPNQDKVILFPGMKPYNVKINALGLRTVGNDEGVTLKDIQDKYRVLALGDSFTFGLFVDDEDSYPYRLQQIISEKGKDAVIFNAGIGGTSISDHLYYFKKKGLQLNPDLVVLNFCANDLGEIIHESPLYEKLKKDNVFNLGRTIKLAKFMRIFRKAQLDYKYNRTLKKINDDRVREIYRTKSEALEDSLYAATFESGISVVDPANAELKQYWDPYISKLDETLNFLKAKEIEVLFFIYPDVLSVYDAVESRYEDILKSYLDRKNVEYIDMVQVFKARPETHLELFNSPPRDFHLSGVGNQILSEAIYNRIKEKF